MIKIAPYHKDRQEEVIGLMRSFEAEFGFRFHYEDVNSIEEYYRKSGGEFFLCLDGSKCIGAGGLAIINGFPCLRRIYVLPEWRKHKAGYLLLQSIFDFAREKGMQKIHITTRSTLSRAVAFYKQLGCIQVSKVPENCPAFGDDTFFEYDL